MYATAQDICYNDMESYCKQIRNIYLDYNYLLNNGYNKDFLNQSLHSLLSLPFLLLLRLINKNFGSLIEAFKILIIP